MSPDLRLAIGLLLLLGIALAVLTAARVDHRRAIVIAAARALLQLSIVALALRGVFAAPAAVVAVIAVMFSAAVWTAARRLSDLVTTAAALRAVAVSCFAGAAVAIVVVVGLPALSRDVRTLVATAGIVLGGTMTAATLTGRRLAGSLREHRNEVEAWLSLGATMRVAVRPVARAAIFEALVPALDQTRTVGMVTLPGAFVGALLGGVSAATAARFQIVVLVALLCAETITAALLAYLLGAPASLPNPER